MAVPEQLVTIHRSAQNGIHTPVKVRDALKWCDPSFKEARRILRLAMIDLGLKSVPSAATASINSTVIFYLKDKMPDGAIMPRVAFRPDISEIQRKLKFHAGEIPTHAKHTAVLLSKVIHSLSEPAKAANPKPIVSNPKPAAPRMELAAFPVFVSPAPSSRDSAIRHEQGMLVVAGSATASEILARLNADCLAQAIIVDKKGAEIGRLSLRTVMLAVAADDGGATAAFLLRA